MHITLNNTGKRFNLEWIFRHVDFEFSSGKSYAIVGANGSGKSTLLQVIAGALMHSEGNIVYTDDQQKPIENDLIFEQMSIAAPYLELIEEMTATEFLTFHQTFKTFIKSIPEILKEIGLAEAANKQIRYFSSGMKQRLKLGQAFFSNTSILLLDEPTTNLDGLGIQLYLRLIKVYAEKRLLIICSNDEAEYGFCDEKIIVEKYK
jgi:ABC-type multidrug transport system ATPase subunit